VQRGVPGGGRLGVGRLPQWVMLVHRRGVQGS
jgi:hypothetical protein